MPSTLSILVNVFPPDERTKAIAIWASVTGAAGAIGPVASGWLLGHFWYGVGVPRQRADHRRRARRRVRSSCPKSRDPEQGQLDPVGARAVDRRHRRRSSTASSRRPSKGWASAGHARRVRASASWCSRCSCVVGAARRRADARHALLPEPGVQHRHRRHDPRVPGDVRRDVPRSRSTSSWCSATARSTPRCGCCRWRRS